VKKSVNRDNRPSHRAGIARLQGLDIDTTHQDRGVTVRKAEGISAGADGKRRGFRVGVVALLLISTSWWVFAPDSHFAHLRAFLNVEAVGPVEVIYATRSGERIQQVLPDQSRIDQNIETESHVRVSARERELTLKHGEVLVDVVLNPRVPFVIRKDDVSIRTQSAAVWVRSMPLNTVRVGVLRDSAEVRRECGGISRMKLHAGDVVTMGPDFVRFELSSPDELTRLTAWKRGEIWLSSDTLEDAAAEFNRYSNRKLVIKDRHTGSMRISGRFYASDVDKFVKALKPLRIDSRALTPGPRGQDVILLSRS
jgi:ferric-dicitrate binding protein FerR (iron transport regulator)